MWSTLSEAGPLHNLALHPRQTLQRAMASKPLNNSRQVTTANNAVHHAQHRPPAPVMTANAGQRPPNTRPSNPNLHHSSKLYSDSPSTRTPKQDELDAVIAEYLTVADEQQQRRLRIEALMVQTEAEMDARMHSIAEEKKALRSSFSELRKQLFSDEQSSGMLIGGAGTGTGVPYVRMGVGEQAKDRGRVEAEYPGRGRTNAIVPLDIGRGVENASKRLVNGTRAVAPGERQAPPTKHVQQQLQQRMELSRTVAPTGQEEEEDEEEEEDGETSSLTDDPLAAPPRLSTSPLQSPRKKERKTMAQSPSRQFRHPALPPNRSFFPERPLLSIPPLPRKGAHAGTGPVGSAGAARPATAAKKVKEGAPRYQPY